MLTRDQIVCRFQQLTADISFDYVNVDFVAYNELDNSYLTVAMEWGATFVSLNLRLFFEFFDNVKTVKIETNRKEDWNQSIFTLERSVSTL